MESVSNIENIVRRIVQSVRDGPRLDSQNRDATSTNTSSPAQDSQEELFQRFNIPRTTVQSVTPATSTFATASVVAQQFNPQNNYGYTGRSRRGRVASSSWPYNTGRGRGRGKGAKPSRGRVEPPTLKEVIVLPKPSTNTVPKYAVKADLHKRGLIIDSVPVERSWSESELRAKIEELFENVLRVNGVNVGFDFVKVIGGTVQSINLPRGTELSGRVLLGIIKQGPLYVRATSSLDSQDDHDSEDDSSSEPCQDEPERMFHPNRSILSYVTTTSNAAEQAHHRDNIPTTSCSSSCLNTEENIQQLIAMFPDVQTHILEETLETSKYDMNAAVSTLLNVAQDALHDGDSDNEQSVWDTPLAATPYLVADDGKEALKEFIHEVVKPFGEELDIHVVRVNDLLKQVLRKYKNPAFDITKPPNVEFSDEPGVDGGGVSREYFHLLMESLWKSQAGGMSLFEGQAGHLVPTHNYDFVSGGLFVLVGKMILHALLNKCKGVPGIARPVVSYLISGKRDAVVEKISLQDIPDPDVQNSMEQILNCTDEELNKLTDPQSEHNISDILVSSGYPHITVTGTTRHLAYECCLLHEVVTKRLAALDDIRKGLASVRTSGITILDLLGRYPDLENHVFPLCTGKVDVKSLRLQIQYAPHCNDKSVNAQNYLDKYLDELSEREGKDEETLNDLLMFWTGYPSFPSDAKTKLHVDYLEDCDSKVMAEASTCCLTISIPTVHASFSQFKDYMHKSITYAKVGFGKM